MFFSEKAKAVLDFFADTATIYQHKGRVHFDVEASQEVFSSWEEFASWLEKFADDMARKGMPLLPQS